MMPRSCRIRKVKCDETKPFCLRCSKTGRACDGYLDPSALASRRRLKDSSPHHLVLGPLLEFSTPEETRSFYFFQHVTAPCISGELEAVFWRTFVLQISQTEPAVRHAVLAVSSLHESLTTAPSVGSNAESFALQQYNKAIAHLLDQMHNPLTKLLASLLTCVLFVCIEFLQGKDKESLIHLEQGRQLLTRLNQRPSSRETEWIVRYIVPLYTKLSLPSFLFGDGPIAIPNLRRPRREIPDTFGTIDDLRASMHDFMEQAFSFTQRSRPAKNSSDSVPREAMQMLEVEQGRLLARLAKINVAFSLFRASSAKHGPNNALLVLQTYLHAQHIWISTALSSSEVVYDDYLSSFAAIVPLAATYLDLESPSKHQGPLAPRPSVPPTEPSQYLPETGHQMDIQARHSAIETHIIPPLYYVATKCRHPLIRRSALNLLRRNPFRRENLWRASVMGALAGRIVYLEGLWAQNQALSTTPEPMCALDGSHMPFGGVYHAAQTSHMTVPQGFRQDDPRREIPPHTMSISTEEMSAAQTITSVLSPLPRQNFKEFDGDQRMGCVIDPALYTDVRASSSLSQAPSLTSSIDGYSSNSAMEPSLAILSPPSNDISAWKQPPQHQHHQNYHPTGSYQPASSEPMSSGPYSCAQTQPQTLLAFVEQPATMADSVSYSSSDGSSPDTYEQYQTFPPQPPSHAHQQHQQQQQQQQYHHQAGMLFAPPLPQQHAHLTGTHIPRNLITEAPFGLPEEMRVHDAIVGPEREDGSWVAVFRKLHGVDADWDIKTAWAPKSQPSR